MAGALALASVSCAPAQTSEAAAVCQAAASGAWQGLTVEAAASGPDCARAAATLVFRHADGDMALAEIYPSKDVMTLAAATDDAAMGVALAEWIDQTAPAFVTSANLPEWAVKADSPVNGDFPFYPNADLDRNSYAALRARAVPVFCYVQGMESMACLALEEGALSPIGVQLFPG